MPLEWWDYSPVIAICCELLNILSDWLKRRHYAHYFIPEANLFHQPSATTLLHQTERRINYFRSYGILCRWFVENYILPITCTTFQLLNTGKVTTNFMDYVLPLLKFRKVAKPLSVECLIALKLQKSGTSSSYIIKTCCSGVRMDFKSEHSKRCFELTLHKEMPELPTIQKVLCFKYCDLLLYSLQFAYSLSNGEISWDCNLLVEFVSAISFQPKIIRLLYHNFPKIYTPESSRYQLRRAQGLMENFTESNSH